MDHRVPAGITEGLRQRGLDVVPAQEDGSSRLNDESLLARAAELGRVLFSQYCHLLIICSRRLQTGQEFAGLIYAHQLAITIGKAVRDLELMATTLDSDDMLNRIEYLPL